MAEDEDGGGVCLTSASTMERGVPGLLTMGIGVPEPEAEPLVLLLVSMMISSWSFVLELRQVKCIGLVK